MLQAKTASNGHAAATPQPRFVKKTAAPPPKPEMPASESAATLLTPYGWVTVEFATITPDVAAALIANKAQNRPPNPRHVEVIANAIRNDEFEFNGESVIVDQNGKLIDGQHRCLAVIDAGQSIDVLMVRGIRNKAFATIDQAAKRTGGQVLGMDGIPDGNNVAAAVRLIEAYKRGVPLWDITQFRPSPAFIKERVQQVYGSMQPNLSLGAAIVNQIGGSRSFYAAMHYLLAEKDRERADKFFTLLSHGEGLNGGDPVLALRNWLIACRVEKVRADNHKRQMFVAFVSAWNASRTGRQLRRIKTDIHSVPAII